MSQESKDPEYDYDVIVIGSGFGGSVAALRLTEKGYRVGVLEAGRRFTRETLPKNSWDLRNYLWAPALGLYGIQRIHLLDNVLVLAGAGVGGGSLNYANTLYVPPEAFFTDRQWSGITDWQDELQALLRPGAADARRAAQPDDDRLGHPPQGRRRARWASATPSTSRRSGCSSATARTARGCPWPTRATSVPDPYFGGKGPARRACTECGECMTGCRHGAKNTLTENYLHLAERAGAVIHPMTTVVGLTEDPNGHGHLVAVAPTDKRRKVRPRIMRARQVVVAAGTYGTQTLLHTVRDRGDLPAHLGPAGRTDPDQLRVAGGRADRQPPLPPGARRGTRGLHPRRGHHLLHPPRRPHPHRAGPLRQGLQRDGPDVASCRSRTAAGCRAGWPTWSTRSATRRSPPARCPTTAGRSAPSSAW